MKINKFTLSVCTVSLGLLLSCNNSNQNNYSEPVTSGTQSESNYQKEQPKADSMERFVGRYSVYGGDCDGVIEVLSDGRVLQISHIISTGEETKEYLGTVQLVSDCAFMVDAPALATLGFSDTPYYVMRNGSERRVGTIQQGAKLYSIVFDVNENRAYLEGLNAYRSRDVSEVEYYKFRH